MVLEYSRAMISVPEPSHLPGNIDYKKHEPTLRDMAADLLNSVKTGLKGIPLVQYGLHLLSPAQTPVHGDLVAWHGYRSLVAVAGSSFIYFYWDDGWVNADQPLINKRFQDGILCLAWSPTSDYLYVSTSSGICCFQAIFEESTRECHVNLAFVLDSSSSQTSLSGHTHQLAFAPDGRLLVSCFNNDRSICVWDTAMKKCTKVWCFDGGLCSAKLRWSPSGLHLAVAATDGMGGGGSSGDDGVRGVVVFVETNEWTCERVAHQRAVRSLAWVGASDLLYAMSGSLGVHHSSMDAHAPVAQPLSNVPAPFSLEADMERITGTKDSGLVIDTLATDPISRRVAVSFIRQDDGVKYHKVAVFLCNCHPTFTMSLSDKSTITGHPGAFALSMAFRAAPRGNRPSLLSSSAANTSSVAAMSPLCIVWGDEDGRKWLSLH